MEIAMKTETQLSLRLISPLFAIRAGALIGLFALTSAAAFAISKINAPTVAALEK
jgi:hypothetical protein